MSIELQVQDFTVEGVHQMFERFNFSGVGTKFYYWESYKIWGNFSKICIKIIGEIIEKLLGKFENKCKKLLQKIILPIMGSPPTLEKF